MSKIITRNHTMTSDMALESPKEVVHLEKGSQGITEGN